VLAKKRSALLRFHAALREGKVAKVYLALVKGRWTQKSRSVTLPLRKYLTAEHERRVSVEQGGQVSRTRFGLLEHRGDFSLLRAALDTGRTHQIRVQLAHLGYPIAGDDKYGDFDLNRQLATRGLRRMFLHAHELGFTHPLTGLRLTLSAPLPDTLARFLAELALPGHHAETL